MTSSATSSRNRDPAGRCARIAYTVSGQGAPLVLLHPIGLNRTWWDQYADALRARHRVIAVDLQGHGASDASAPGARLQDLAQGVLSVLDAEFIDRAHVLGVSMGGMVAQHLALAKPDRVASLLLCSTAGDFDDALRPKLRERGHVALTAGMQAVIEPTLNRWFSPATRDGALGRKCATTLATHDPLSWAICWDAISRHNARPELRTLPVPALVITGSHDVSTPPAAAQALAEAIPNSQLKIVAGASHLGVFENPSPFLRAFTDFLEEEEQ
jgi:3-oxoadipate enol-lactonase